MTKNGDAKYKLGINVEALERLVWQEGVMTNNDKPWKVMKFDQIVGAKNGIETNCIRVELSANTIHGHPPVVRVCQHDTLFHQRKLPLPGCNKR